MPIGVAVRRVEKMANPAKGTPMPGCGGLRKVRTADPRRGKGKQGGARIIYLYVPEAKWFFLLDIYGKDEKADLSAAEKKHLCSLVTQLKFQAKEAAKH
jgi:putative transcriptional regulator